jgi:hypothetical protein
MRIFCRRSRQTASVTLEGELFSSSVEAGRDIKFESAGELFETLTGQRVRVMLSALVSPAGLNPTQMPIFYSEPLRVMGVRQLDRAEITVDLGAERDDTAMVHLRLVKDQFAHARWINDAHHDGGHLVVVLRRNIIFVLPVGDTQVS